MDVQFLFVLAVIIFGILTRQTLGHICGFQIQEDHSVSANCNGNHLTSLPAGLPSNMTYLDLSNNDFSVLPHFSTYPSLQYLDLSYNYLQTLGNESFAVLQKLTWLNLSNNRLQKLDVGTFAGLHKLIHLDLWSNHLIQDYDTYSPGIFQPLISLQELYLDYNDDRGSGDYLDDVYQIPTLRTLRVDGKQHFGVGFSALKSLKSLYITDYCNIYEILNDTLEAFRSSQLELLEIQNCRNLVRLELCAFCNFSSLKVLSILGTNLVTVNSALGSLYGLQYLNMSEIKFVDIKLHTSGVIITPESARFLRNICVTNLTMYRNHITEVKSNSFSASNSPFIRCLQNLDLSSNRIKSDPYELVRLFLRAHNLRSIDLTDQGVFTISDSACSLGQNKKYCYGENLPTPGLTFSFPFPPSLSYVNFSGGLAQIRALPPILNFTANSLNTLDLSFCGINNCLTDIYGLERIEVLDISGNGCNKIKETIFDHFPKLRYLGMSNLNLNPDFVLKNGRRLFQNLEMLQTLDLSYNYLQHIYPDMLAVQTGLHTLNLAGNRLHSLSINMQYHPELSILDLSKNEIPVLLLSEREALDNLAEKHMVVLRLQGNPLLCACSTLDFVQWLWSTRVVLEVMEGDGRNLTCLLDTGEMTNTAAIMAEFDFQWRRCVGATIFGAAVAAFLMQVLLLVIVLFIKRSWTHIRYAWNVLHQIRVPSRRHFCRDVFAVYADQDWRLACEWLPRNLQPHGDVRWLLRDEEELPGSIKAENIIRFIDYSWKVLLLVSCNFAEDEWACGFTVQQAQRSITDTMPDRVLVIFLDPPKCLPALASLENLLRVVPERNIFHIPRNTSPHHQIWQQLYNAIVHSDRNALH